MATNDQKNQFISLIATRLNPGRFHKNRFQTFLRDPEGLDRLADEFINTYMRRTYPVVEISEVTATALPDWSKGRVLNGRIRCPSKLDFLAVMESAYFHPRQTDEEYKNNRPQGHDILDLLVLSYETGGDKVGNTYDIIESDSIHGHFGLAELTYMKKNWSTLPEPFKAWAKEKLLFGWRDLVRDGHGDISVPCLDSRVDEARVVWFSLDYQWGGVFGPALREQVSPGG